MAAEGHSATGRGWSADPAIPNDAQAYERLDDHGQLSEQLLWSVLTKSALRALPHGFRFCDAGGGSGRWSRRILAERGDASGVLLRGPERQLASAEESNEEHGDRLRIAPDLCGIADKSFDLAFSLHDMLAAAEQPGTLLKQLVRITKPGGFIAVVAPNLYHAIFLNLAHARLQEAERALTGRASYRPGAPERNVFTPRSLEEMVVRAGACPRATVGFPTVVHPSSADPDLREGQTFPAAALANEESRRRIVAIEEALLMESGPAPRGIDLISIAIVPSTAQRWGDFWLDG
jgi:SAM-dependent methyltransferase